ncbi:TetR/AcrR family transcriptional regulator [Rhodococcus sp. HNM0563]|uniref:TetR/AcrR family transcriptional regulator n=1 Tax=unclassified Rhodococcus (in: high G+C Gram-positive bacteria) TaxID=192944 RepID=UPI00146DD64E|nr:MULTISPECIES: TetR/AcrR family transcriptional regulator [unclassified Rhodococcus (in: high G+C Gram-positive bacteria)]MCK0090888.1 TetR/AcrR family transcriptional regulator [Rhodococcus sp. F64268]NLU61070.1 TetR/AcrR family transcriptional regulator [Rhodococcus sp. HNM0563]
MSSVEESVPSPRKRANANRSRILDAAMRCFAANSDASMDDVAKAAGVVRRTVYAHFPNRDALVEGLADEAGTALAASVEQPEPEDADVALAVGVLRLSPVGDRYRVLLSFARKEVGEERIAELIAPVRTHTCGVVERGRAAGVFSAYLPTVVLVGMMEGLTMATLEQANHGVVDDASRAMALGVLVLAGVTPDRAAEVVASAQRWLHARA